MKTTFVLCGVAALLFAAIFQSRAGIIAGPITNPANGHDYYLLSPNTWTMAEAEAESLGGTLAIIRNPGEDKWVFTNFSGWGGVNRTLWIGLHKNWSDVFVWVNGEPTNYVNWGRGQPDNAGGAENSVQIWPPDSDVRGTWNDASDSTLNCGVVELPGKAGEQSLTKRERALIGNWYEGGKVERPCWIAATDNLLFVIPNHRLAARAGFCADGSLFAADTQGEWPMVAHGFGNHSAMMGFNPQAGMRGEIINDRILWNNGTWWSRKPVEFKTGENPAPVAAGPPAAKP